MPGQKQGRVQGRETPGELTHGSLKMSLAKNSNLGYFIFKVLFTLGCCTIYLVASEKSYKTA